MSEHQIKKISEPVTDDEHDGNLQFSFGTKNGMVIVDFGKLVKWIGLPPDDADEFARLMVKAAQQTRNQNRTAKT